MKTMPLSKADVLALLAEVGAKGCSADDLAGLLAEAGFRDPASPARLARLEAGGWLRRLNRQGLVEGQEGQRTLQYRLPGREEPVERRQRVVTWRITEKGLGRLKWLQKHRSGPESPSGGQKRPKSGRK